MVAWGWCGPVEDGLQWLLCMQNADQSLASPSGHVMVGVLGPEGRVADPC